ncbi:hypothetical protein D3C71_1308420 [compost metagenome]
MAFAEHDDQLVIHPLGDLKTRLMVRAFDKADIHFQPLNGSGHLTRVADDQIHMRLPVDLQQVGDAGRHQVIADGGAGPYPPAHRRDGLPPGAEAALDIRHAGQQRPCLRQQGAAMAVEHQPAPDPVEQRQAQQALQLTQGGAHRRLRQTNGFAGGGGGSGFGNGREDLQLAQGEMHLLPIKQVEYTNTICFTVDIAGIRMGHLLITHRYEHRYAKPDPADSQTSPRPVADGRHCRPVDLAGHPAVDAGAWHQRADAGHRDRHCRRQHRLWHVGAARCGRGWFFQSHPAARRHHPLRAAPDPAGHWPGGRDRRGDRRAGAVFHLRPGLVAGHPHLGAGSQHDPADRRR